MAAALMGNNRKGKFVAVYRHSPSSKPGVVGSIPASPTTQNQILTGRLRRSTHPCLNSRCKPVYPPFGFWCGRMKASDSKVGEIVFDPGKIRFNDAPHLVGLSHDSRVKQQLVVHGGRRIQHAFHCGHLPIPANRRFQEP